MPIFNKRLESTKITKAQLLVLQEIARGGRSSKASLARRLGKNYPDINDSVDVLCGNEMLVPIDEEHGRGRPQIFYGLTDKSVEFLSRSSMVVLDFWKMIFFAFDKTTKHKHLTFPLDEVITEYQQNVLTLQMEYVPLFFTELRHMDILSGYNSSVEVRVTDFLKLFAINGQLTLEKFYHDYKNYLRTLGYEEKIIFQTIDLMFSEELLVKVNHRGKIMYRLSHYGLLFFLRHLRHDFLIRDKVECRAELRSVVSNYTNLLPLVFQKWTRLRMIIDEEFLLEIFSRLYFSDIQYLSDNIDLSKSRLLANILYSMDVIYRGKMKEFARSGIHVFHEWLNERGVSVKFEDLIDKLSKFQSNKIEEFLKKIIQVDSKKKKLYFEKIRMIDNILPIIEKIVKLVQNLPPSEVVSSYASMDNKIDSWYRNYWEITESSLQNIISFQFYSLFRFNIKQEEWNNFLSKDQDLKKWYVGWMNAISKFEEENIKSIRTMVIS